MVVVVVVVGEIERETPPKVRKCSTETDKRQREKEERGGGVLVDVVCWSRFVSIGMSTCRYAFAGFALPPTPSDFANTYPHTF